MPVTLLLFNDEEILAHFTARTIQTLRPDWLVLHANSIDEALDLVDRCRPNVALLDVQLPNGTGFKLTRDLHKRSPNLPIVFLSAFVPFGTADRLRREGVSAVVEKPHGARHLVSVLEKALRRGSQAAPDAPTPPRTHQKGSKEPKH